VRTDLLRLLACPRCAGEFRLVDAEEVGGDIVRGQLICASCADRYPIARGVPRFVEGHLQRGTRATAQKFGAQWRVFDELGPHHDAQFRDWIAPVTEAFIRGRCVLELGCGKGRHTRLVAAWGAREVVAVDISAAVDIAYDHTRDYRQVHVIQADINKLPLKRAFDYAFSVGVIHHLENPAAGFRALVDRVCAEGAVSCWVYGRENNGWIVHLVNPLRRLVFSRLPIRLLYYVALVCAIPLYGVVKFLSCPMGRRWPFSRLGYGDYLRYIATFPYREIHTIVFDHLNAPTAFYITRTEFERWFVDAGLVQTAIAWHNRNSWRGFGLVPSSAPHLPPCAVSAESFA
jgi:SAM-dependent methyltransferase